MSQAYEFQIDETNFGTRLDKYLSDNIADLSRSRCQKWIAAGYVLINGMQQGNKYKLQIKDHIVIDVPDEIVEPEIIAEDIPINIIFEDAHLLVVNKPAGMVVHPAAGNYQGTLQNALLYHYPELASLPRSGIVHRLDKLTSGILVIAKTNLAHISLVEQLQTRNMSREYDAIVCGEIIAGSSVEANIGRHPVDRKKMAVLSNGGKEAITHYRVFKKYQHYTHLKVNLETGRTHQIRVHMASLKYPLIGDPEYGGRLRLPKGYPESAISTLRDFKRQALHAAQLTLQHPATNDTMQWSAPLPDDMQNLLMVLQPQAAAF